MSSLIGHGKSFTFIFFSCPGKLTSCPTPNQQNCPLKPSVISFKIYRAVALSNSQQNFFPVDQLEILFVSQSFHFNFSYLSFFILLKKTWKNNVKNFDCKLKGTFIFSFSFISLSLTPFSGMMLKKSENKAHFPSNLSSCVFFHMLRCDTAWNKFPHVESDPLQCRKRKREKKAPGINLHACLRDHRSSFRTIISSPAKIITNYA